MGGVRTGLVLSNKKRTVSIVIIAAIAVMLVGSTAFAGHVAEAKSKSKHKIRISFGSLGGWDGKITVKLKNEDTHKVLLKENVDFKKLYKQQKLGNGPKSCCYVIFSFDPKDSHKGDSLRAIAIEGANSNGGGWESAAQGYKKGTLEFSIDLDEIGCDAANDC